MSEYVCPAHVGEPDYTQHDLYGDGIHINSSSFISFQVKVIYFLKEYFVHQHEKIVFTRIPSVIGISSFEYYMTRYFVINLMRFIDDLFSVQRKRFYTASSATKGIY